MQCSLHDVDASTRHNDVTIVMTNRRLGHGDLAVLGQHLTLVVVLTIQDAVRLGIVVQFEGHLALATLEAQFVVDLVACFLSFLGVHGLGTNLTLLSLGRLERHGAGGGGGLCVEAAIAEEGLISVSVPSQPVRALALSCR